MFNRLSSRLNVSHRVSILELCGRELSYPQGHFLTILCIHSFPLYVSFHHFIPFITYAHRCITVEKDTRKAGDCTSISPFLNMDSLRSYDHKNVKQMQ